MKRIHIADKHIRILIKEFDVTNQTIYNALRYFTYSDLAHNIRKRAKELLQEEANAVDLSRDQGE